MAKSKKIIKRKRFKNDRFLIALGKHCQRLRERRGVSIDRMAKESDEHLSPSVIHRLESGQGAVTVSAVFRYARALGLKPKDLLDFDYPWIEEAGVGPYVPEVHPFNDPRAEKLAYKQWLPLYSLRAAADVFGESRDVQAEGWIDLGRGRKIEQNMFIVRVMGESMAPLLHDGDYVVMRAHISGSRQGKVVLCQYRGPADPDTGGSYTIKKYKSSKVATSQEEWQHQQILLEPLNPDYEPILIMSQDEGDFRVIAEYLYTMKEP